MQIPGTTLLLAMAAILVATLPLCLALDPFLRRMERTIRRRIRNRLHPRRRRPPVPTMHVRVRPGTTIGGRTYRQPADLILPRAFAQSLVLRGVAHEVARQQRSL